MGSYAYIALIAVPIAVFCIMVVTAVIYKRQRSSLAADTMFMGSVEMQIIPLGSMINSSTGKPYTTVPSPRLISTSSTHLPGNHQVVNV